MEKGVLVESNTTADLFAAPQHPIAPAARQRAATAVEPVAAGAQTILDAASRRRLPHRGEGLALGARQDDVPRRARRAMSLKRGETLGIVGESAGKSTLASAVLGLQRPASGGIEIDGMPLASLRTTQGRRTLRAWVVFQDPFGSLSPRMTVEQIVGEGLVHRPQVAGDARGADRRAAAGGGPAGRGDAALSARVFRRAAAADRDRAGAGGGAGTAGARRADERARCVDPEAGAESADESPKEYKLSYLFITHDLAVMRAMAHRVIVMKATRGRGGRDARRTARAIPSVAGAARVVMLAPERGPQEQQEGTDD